MTVRVLTPNVIELPQPPAIEDYSFTLLVTHRYFLDENGLSTGSLNVEIIFDRSKFAFEEYLNGRRICSISLNDLKQEIEEGSSNIYRINEDDTWYSMKYNGNYIKFECDDQLREDSIYSVTVEKVVVNQIVDYLLTLTQALEI